MGSHRVGHDLAAAATAAGKIEGPAFVEFLEEVWARLR